MLDLRTIYLAGAITCLFLGVVQLSAYATGRFERWPLWWGLSNLLVGIGLTGLGLRDIAPDAITIQLGNGVTWIGCLLLLFSVRSFAGRPARLPLYVLAVAVAFVPILFWREPADYTKRAVLISALLAACDLAVVREGLRLVKREKLLSGAILAAVFAPTAVLLAFRAYLAATNQIGSELFPPDNSRQWLTVTGVAFIVLRSSALLLLATERSRNALVTLARHDPLTGAMNRNGLERAIARLTQEAGRRQCPVALLLIDIDHFKQLNDTHGHLAGDRILRTFAEAAGGRLRSGDIVARLGGDEFVVVLPHLGMGQAVSVANDIRSAFSRVLAAEPNAVIRATLSIGIADGDAVREPLETLLRRADQALYRSKRLGRDRVQVEALAS
ncbi:GGDEF domain-containing protein [Bosea sp. LjRoot90]|uniref:GGDEF domain-containing protein n=1 Tax=Bosea sp. LjRoot90 TaxID=3342342 RepID=UPI003ECD7D70